MSEDSSGDAVVEGLQEAAEVHDSLEAGRVLSAVRAGLFGGEPARFGRFVVLEKLGAGATAVVYAGYDPELDRRVAIKVLKHAGHRERLLREAKAMARLRHPHVVGVHQLGTEGDRVFVAMEHVDGSTLNTWMQTERRWEEVVDVFLQAGEGLAAAHEAGLVHRDFKPDNLLIDNQGQARVADFGLVRLAEEAAAPLDLEAMQAETLTISGALVGTPAYMAPEIFAGEPADERSDQFSFCVTLFEALHGERPFRADDIHELAEAIRTGTMTPPTQARGVPRKVSEVIARGLRSAREERYPSMAALVTALRAARGYRRRRLLAVAAGAVVTVAALAAHAWPTAPPLCQNSEDELDEIWDRTRRAAIERAFAGTGLPYAGDVFETTAEELDRYAAAWTRMHRETCEATRVRGEQSEAVLDVRMRCLDRRRESLRALTDILTAPSPEVVQRAAEAANGLDDLRGCADVEALMSGGRLPDEPALRSAVEGLRAELTKCQQIRATGRMEEALALAKDIHARVEATGFRPLLAEATLELARASLDLEKLEEAEKLLDAAFALAVATRQDEVAAWAAVDAIYLVGFRRREPARGHRWAWLARPLVERVEASPRLSAMLLNNEGTVYWVEGELDEVRKRFAEAVDVLDEAHGARHLQVGFARANLGALLRKQGEHAAAQTELTAAESILRENLGDNHPKMGQILNSIGNLYAAEKDFARGADYHRRALALKEATLPPDHPSIAHSHNNLADLLIETPAHDEAAEHYREALARWEKVHGDAYPLLAFPLRGLGRIALARDDRDGAIALLERALMLVEKEGSNGPERAETEWHLARALVERDRPRALRLARSAATRFEALGPAQAEPAREVRDWLRTMGP